MKLKYILLLLYTAVFAVCAISPYDRAVWVAENLPIVLLVGFVVLVSRHFEFSNFSYGCLFVLPVLHTIGGHYTFERVPFDLVTNTFSFERNHYDRVAHFSVGFYAYPLAEYYYQRGLVTSRAVMGIFSVCAILALASAYEIFEWIYAVSSDPRSGSAVLGSQGDVWDAQKDMLADGLGALLAALWFVFSPRKGGSPIHREEKGR